MAYNMSHRDEICPYVKRDLGLDAIKGVLILLVICGHVRSLRQNVDFFVNAFYVFHVAGFLLLPFLMPAMELTKQNVVKAAVRYLWPFALFFAFYAFVYQVSLGFLFSWTDVGQSFVAGLVIASSRFIDAACGFKLLWFLPALFMLLLVRATLQRFPHMLLSAFVLGLLVHLSSSWLGMWRYAIPWGLIIVFFILPIGMIFERIMPIAQRMTRGGRLSLVLCAGALVVFVGWQNFKYDLGDLLFVKPSRIELLPLIDATVLTVCTSLVLFKDQIASVTFLQVMGRYSLELYLLHPLIMEAGKRASQKYGVHWSIETAAVIMSSVALAYVIRLASQKWPTTYRLVFPKEPRDLRVGVSAIALKKG